MDIVCLLPSWCHSCSTCTLLMPKDTCIKNVFVPLLLDLAHFPIMIMMALKYLKVETTYYNNVWGVGDLTSSKDKRLTNDSSMSIVLSIMHHELSVTPERNVNTALIGILSVHCTNQHNTTIATVWPLCTLQFGHPSTLCCIGTHRWQLDALYCLLSLVVASGGHGSANS